MKILVVDDERWIRKGILKMIQKDTLRIEELLEADSVERAWELFQKETPEIVISDVKFPVQNGCILCEKIYNVSPQTKIIMLSGYGDFAYVKAALKFKAVDYLLKPVDKIVLNQTIEKAITEIRNEVGIVVKRAGEQKRRNGALKSEEIIKEVINEIQNHYNQKISLSDMAKKYYINETYLSDLFTRNVGVSLVNYIMNIRVEKSKALLMMTRMSITEIAATVGYEDAKYFTRVFKKVSKETPKEFRKRLEQEIHDDNE